jgi:hypothetical protein
VVGRSSPRVYVVRLRADALLEGQLGVPYVRKTYITYRVEADSAEDAVARLGRILGGQESYRFEDGVYRR